MLFLQKNRHTCPKINKMKYLELDFTLTPHDEDATDLLAALAAQAGLESFVSTGSGMKGYVQHACFQKDVLDNILSDFPMPAVRITYAVREAEDRNWNEEWEKQGFAPVCIGDKVCIHQPGQTGLPTAKYQILIEPHQAFGTGQHQTTGMILRRLADMDLTGKRVLDAGCGTGILGIFCAMKGASNVFAYDIDSWSVRNTLQNMALNHVGNIDVMEGDAALLQGRGLFSLVLANINRNILWNDLPAFSSVLASKGQIILSGFYSEDIPVLTERAESLGLNFVNHTENERWASLLFQK